MLPISANSPRTTLNIVSPVPSRTRAVSTPAPPRLNTTLPPRPYSRSPSPSHSHARLPSFSLVGALEFREVVTSLQQQAASSSLSMFETPVTPYAGGHYHSHSHSRTRTPRTSLTNRDEEHWSGSNGLPLDERARSRSRFLSSLTPGVEEGPESAQSSYLNGNNDYFGGSQHGHTPVPSIFRTPASPTLSNSESTVQIFAPSTRRQRFVHAFHHVFHTLFPTLHHLREQSVLGQIACMFAAPAVTLLTLTLPVVVTPYECSHSSREKNHQNTDGGRLVDFEEEGIERVLIAEEEVQENMHELVFNKWLMAAQCIFGPLFCTKVLFSGYFSLTTRLTINYSWHRRNKI